MTSHEVKRRNVTGLSDCRNSVRFNCFRCRIEVYSTRIGAGGGLFETSGDSSRRGKTLKETPRRRSGRPSRLLLVRRVDRGTVSSVVSIVSSTFRKHSIVVVVRWDKSSRFHVIKSKKKGKRFFQRWRLVRNASLFSSERRKGSRQARRHRVFLQIENVFYYSEK